MDDLVAGVELDEGDIEPIVEDIDEDDEGEGEEEPELEEADSV